MQELIKYIYNLYLENKPLKNYIDSLLMENEPNFWDIIEYGDTKNRSGISAHETRYSRMLKWLVDPSENHRLGHFFVRELLKSTYNLSDKVIEDEFSDNFKVGEIIDCRTEKENIDVYYYNQTKSIQVAIELKQYSTEHNSSHTEVSQLANYMDVLQKKSGKIYALYLTPLGDEPSEGNEDWKSVNYDQIITILDSMILINKNMDFVKVIKDFIQDLRRTAINLDFLRFSKDLTNQIYLHRNNIQDYYEKIITDSDSAIEYKRLLMRLGFEEEKVTLILELLYNRTYIQNHDLNVEVQDFIERITEYYTGRRLKPKESLSIKQEFQNDVIFGVVERTSGKGQGLRFLETLNSKDIGHIYCSGDSKGNFPNDGFHFYSKRNKEIGKKPRVNFKLLKINVSEYHDEEKFKEYMSDFHNTLLKASKDFNKLTAQNDT